MLPVFMILRSKIYFMRAPARSAILSKNWLYRQTERPERSAPVFFVFPLFIFSYGFRGRPGSSRAVRCRRQPCSGSPCGSASPPTPVSVFRTAYSHTFRGQFPTGIIGFLRSLVKSPARRTRRRGSPAPPPARRSAPRRSDSRRTLRPCIRRRVFRCGASWTASAPSRR